MMRADVRARREARLDGYTNDPSRETLVFGDADVSGRSQRRRPKEQPPRKLSGKRTAREMNFWKAGDRLARLTEGEIPASISARISL